MSTISELIESFAEIERRRREFEKSPLPSRELVASIARDTRRLTEAIATIRDPLAGMRQDMHKVEELRRTMMGARLEARRMWETSAPLMSAGFVEIPTPRSIPPISNRIPSMPGNRIAQLEERVAALEALLAPPEPPTDSDDREMPGQYL